MSVCLPALNESPTIGGICRSIAGLLAEGLVDELIVMDSGSSDDTFAKATDAGARVHRVSDVLPPIDAPGKGGTLWKSLAVVTGDVVVWLDSDVQNFRASFVTDLLRPLLFDEDIRLTKAFYRRPLETGAGLLSSGGGRVTELTVRPFAHLVFPELTHVVQPLSGECAGYREDLSSLPFFSGYGVEIGLLIDFIHTFGAEALAQVDLGSRIHRNQELPALGRMAFQVLQVMTRRAEDLGRLKLSSDRGTRMLQFPDGADGAPMTYELPVIELPPMKGVLAGA